MRLREDIVYLFGSDGRVSIHRQRILRLLKNINPQTLCEELISQVKERKMSYLAFQEEKNGLEDFLVVLFSDDDVVLTQEEEIDYLTKKLTEGYRLAELELKKLDLGEY